MSLKRLCLIALLLAAFLPRLAAQGGKADSLRALLAKGGHPDTVAAEIMADLAVALHSSKPDSTLVWAGKALRLSELRGFERGKGLALFATGLAFYKKQDYENADKSYLRSADIFKAQGLDKLYCNTLKYLSGSLHQTGNYPLSLEYGFLALDVALKNEDAINLADIYNSIGITYYNQSKRREALTYYKKSLFFYTRNQNNEGVATISLNIGEVYQELDSLDRALEYLSKSEKMFSDIKDDYGLGYARVELAEVYDKQGQFVLAEKSYLEGLRLFREGRHEWEITYARSSMAGHYLKTKKTGKAIAAADSVLRNSKDPLFVKNAADVMHQCFAQQGDFSEAYRYHRLFKNITDSLLNAEKDKKITSYEMQHRFDQEKAEAEKKQAELDLAKTKEMDFQRMLFYIALLLIVFMLVLAGVSFRSYRHKQKSAEIIQRRNEEIEAQSEQIALQRDATLKSYDSVRRLSEIGKEITTHLSVEAIIDVTYQEVNRLMPAEGFGIGIYNAVTGMIDFPCFIEKGEKFPPSSEPASGRKFMSSYCFELKKEIILSDARTQYGDYVEGAEASPIIGEMPDSVLFLPLICKEKPLGVITAQSFSLNAYSDQHVDLLRNIAVYTAIALDNAAALFQIEEQKDEIAAKAEEVNQAYEELNATLEMVKEERQKSDKLLLNILPLETARELKDFGRAIPKSYENATIIFTDFKNFTQAAEILSAEEIVESLHYCFRNFDRIVKKHGLEKIKTIGDAYMCAGGLPAANDSHAFDAVSAALEMLHFMKHNNNPWLQEGKITWELRVGINTGRVVSGVVGRDKFAYDIWGDAVNLAARMESSGEPGRLNISENTYNFVKNDFICEYRGKILAKNKGEVNMYFVNGPAQKTVETVTEK